MSLTVCVHVEEGIVLASDSRVSYNQSTRVDGKEIELFGVHVTNNTNKTFICPNNTGISVCGDSCIENKPITGYIEAFIREKIKKETNVDDIPMMIKEYFIALNPNLDTTFVIAGYKKEKEKYIQKIYRVRTTNEKIEIINTDAQGALWSGETLTLTKLLRPVYLKDENGNYIELPNPEFAWNYYTLQDAVDFAKYAIKTTIDTMRFQSVCETVGEPIDILIIKPELVKWLEKKELNS